MRLVLLVLVPGTALAEPRTLEAEVAGAEQGLAKLSAGIRARDARAIQRQFAKTLHFNGAWFADTACRKRFSRREVLKATSAQAALAKCLAGVRLQHSTRSSASGDGAVLTIEPGVEVELAFDGNRVRWMAFVGQQSDDALFPTLTAQAFEALRTAGATNLDDKLKKRFEKPRVDFATAWLRVCVDAKGTVTSTVRETNPVQNDEVLISFIAATVDWKFKPFSPAGVPTAACSLAFLSYPAAKAPRVEMLPQPASPPIARTVDDDLDGDEGGVVVGSTGAPPRGPPVPPLPPPPPPPPPIRISPQELEVLRIGYRTRVVPDAVTIKAMKAARKTSVSASFNLCVAESGLVSTILTEKSSAFPSYDKALTTAIQAWRFEPYRIKGQPQYVCTVQTFAYRPK